MFLSSQHYFQNSVGRLVNFFGYKSFLSEKVEFVSMVLFKGRTIHYESMHGVIRVMIFCFIFSVTIESLGAMPPDALFRESIRVLKGKCRKFLAEINRGYGDA